MLLSLALILLIGYILNATLNRFNIPGLIALIFMGIAIGPHAFDLISPSILNISTEIREIALIVILMRAGLSLNVEDLKKVGRPAVLMSFFPATLEIISTILLAPILFGVSYIEAAIMGTVLAAVSPAVVVPKMINLIDKGYGKKRGIPQLIMAGASIDDIYVIVLFTSFMGIYQGGSFNPLTLLNVPISIVTGLILGIILGLTLIFIFKKIHIRDTIKVLIILSCSFVLLTLEHQLKNIFPISGLLAVMALGGTFLKQYQILAKRLKIKFTKIWIFAEIFLFVLVGAAVDISSLSDAGLAAVILIFAALLARLIGVTLSLLKTQLNIQERIFCSISYLPKATVQAAIGALPLAAGVKSGEIILTIAVLGIIISAPIGAWGIDLTYKKFLKE